MWSKNDYFQCHYKALSFLLLIPPKGKMLKLPYWMIAVPHLVLICSTIILDTVKLCSGGSEHFSSDMLNLGIAALHVMAINSQNILPQNKDRNYLKMVKDYFYWHYKISFFYLMIPPQRPILKVPFWFVRVPHSIVTFLALFLEAAQPFLGDNQDFSSNVLDFEIVFLHFDAVVRVGRWLFIKDDFDIVIERIRKINLDFSLFGYPNYRSERRMQLNINIESNPIEYYRLKELHRAKLFCLKLVSSFIFYVALNLVVSYTLNYQNATYEKWNPRINRTSIYRDYPYPLWYPFDTSISDGYYWLAFWYQPYAFFFLMGSFFCVDALCINTMFHLTSHVNILGYAFTYIDRNIDSTLRESDIIELKEKRLLKCITELQEIYNCGKMLNDIFSMQLLIQGICIAVIICCSVYRVTSVTLGVETAYLSSMVVVCIIENFNTSWFSQGFTLEIFRLLHRVYDLDWINYPPKQRKLLVFLMKRLQKPFYFTMGFWHPIDVSVFIATIKASYSFYTLITQTSSKLSESKVI